MGPVIVAQGSCLNSTSISVIVGATSDLESATAIARAMVTRFGMTDAVSVC